MSIKTPPHNIVRRRFLFAVIVFPVLRNGYPKPAEEHNRVIITNNGMAETVRSGIEKFHEYEEFCACYCHMQDGISV